MFARSFWGHKLNISEIQIFQIAYHQLNLPSLGFQRMPGQYPSLPADPNRYGHRGDVNYSDPLVQKKYFGYMPYVYIKINYNKDQRS